VSLPIQILQQYWGYPAFRGLQADIVQSVMDGHDTLALLPTGGGKSICFQVPALAKPGICLVVSPLIALIKDQVDNLKRKGIPALAIYAGMGYAEVRKTLQNAAFGNYRFLYVSPERLETDLFAEYLPAMKVNLLAVDEAHCISQWGYDFRPSYLRIAALREQLPGVPVIALTASATPIVQQDIADKLQLTTGHRVFLQSFERPNLSYSVFEVPAKQVKLLEIVNNVRGSAIVYCKTRRRTKEVADLLKANGHSAGYYHAGLSGEERAERQADWMTNRLRIMACTNAFGMGIDKPDVRLVVHYEAPDCLENYYQEAGRAGRDGKRAYAVLLYHQQELSELQQLPALRFPEEAAIRKVYKALMNYLQIPAHTGGGQWFDVDMGVFASRFQLDVLVATYAIKAMEQEALLTYNEVFFKPATVVFTVSKSGLAEFERGYPHLVETARGLLRSYEGIFDFTAIINERNLAQLQRKETHQLQVELRQLHQLGVIEYTPPTDRPQIGLLQHRSHTDDFRFNSPAYFKRKELFAQRVQALIEYVQNTGECRSRLLAAYFGSPAVKPCGICDNCINQQALIIPPETFDALVQTITAAAAQQTPLNDLLKNRGHLGKQQLWKVLNYLLGEEKVVVTGEGNLKMA
jgi:ATP-dependent DNA helicase RecQ